MDHLFSGAFAPWKTLVPVDLVLSRTFTP